MSEFKQKLESEMDTIMERLGYRRKKSYGLYYVRETSSNISWTVEYQVKSFMPMEKTIWLYPHFGVRYKNAELTLRKINTELLGNKYVLPTVSTFLSSVVDESTPISIKYTEFTDSQEFLSIVSRIYEKWMKPYLETYSDIDNLIERFENEGAGYGNAPDVLRLPILYYFRGYALSRGMGYVERTLRRKPSLSSLFTDEYIENYKKLYEKPPAGLESVECKAAQCTAASAADESKGKISGLIDKVKLLF